MPGSPVAGSAVEMPPTVVMVCATIETMTLNRATHQYSLRLARPLKVAYFLKNRWMASPNFAP
jgi:hypothetical protein